MTDYARLEQILTDNLHLSRRPVAVAFRDEAPPDVAPLLGTQPSGCSFWRLAGDGATFYTVPSDHYNCPVGSYTHAIPLPPERAQELPQVLTLMSGIGYLRMDEVPGIPRLPRMPAVTVYAPLANTPVDPDVVVVSGKPGTMMLLQEAAIGAQKSTSPMLGRPTCMAIPAALSTSVVSSLGCVGNRIYTEQADDEFYAVIGGKDLAAVVAQLGTVQQANAALTEYHQGRRATLSTA